MSEDFVIGGDASPLIRELNRASAELRKFGSQQIAGPTIAPSSSGNLVGGLLGDIERQYAQVTQRVATAQQNMLNTIASTPKGQTATLQTRGQFDKIAKDAVGEINQAAARAVRAGVPIDVAQMFATDGVRAVLTGLGAEMSSLQAQARAFSRTAGVRYDGGLGGFGTKALERRMAAADTSLRGLIDIAQRQHAGRQAMLNDLSQKFESVRAAGARSHADMKKYNDDSKAAVKSELDLLERKKRVLGEIHEAYRRSTPSATFVPDPSLPSSRLQIPAGSTAARPGSYTTLSGYTSAMLGMATPTIPPPPPLPPIKHVTPPPPPGASAATELAQFLGQSRISGVNDALDAVTTLRSSSGRLNESQKYLIRETEARVKDLQKGHEAFGARQKYNSLDPSLVSSFMGAEPPGTPPRPIDRRGLSNAFLGGLTSRGFGRGDGDHFNLEGIAATAGTTAKYAVLATAIYGVMAATRQGAKEFLDYRDSLTDVASALADTDAQFSELRGNAVFGGGLVSSGFENDLQEMSRLAGTNVGQQLDAAARGIRAFGDIIGSGPNERDSQAELQAFGTSTAEAVTQLAVITKTDYRDQTGNIIAIAQAYGLQADQLSRVVDAVANSRKLGGDLAQTSQGLANFATIAVESGLSLQEAANLISAIQAKTDQGGTLIATRLTRITQIINSAGGQRVLAGTGIDTNQGVLQQLSALSKKYQDGSLTDAQQKSLTSRLAGTANAREFTVALKEMKDILEQADPSLAKAGEGAKLFQRNVSDVAGTLRKIRGDIKNIIVELSNSGIFAPLLAGIQLLEPGLRTIADLLEAINSIGGDAGGIVRGLGIGTVEILAMIALFKKFQASKAAAFAVTSGTSAQAVTGVAGASYAAKLAAAEGLAMQATIRRTAANVAATEIEALRAQSQLRMAEGAMVVARAEHMSATSTEAKAAAYGALITIQKEYIGLLKAETAATKAAALARGEYTALVNAQTVTLAANTAASTASTGAATMSAMTGAFGAVGSRLGASRLPGYIGAFNPLNPFRTPAGTVFNGRVDARFPAPAGEVPTSQLSRRPTLAGALTALVGVTLLNSALQSLGETSKKAAEANEAQAMALDKVGQTDVATPQGLRSASEDLRSAAGKQREAADGFWAGFKRRAEGFGGGLDRSAIADSLERQADSFAARAERLEAAQNRSAARGEASVFQDVQSVEGLTSGLESLDAVGTSATKTIDLLVEALGGVVSTDKGQGTILPGQLPTIQEELRARFEGALGDAYVNAVKASGRTIRSKANDIDAPELDGARKRIQGFLPGNPLDDTKLEFLGPPQSTGKLTPRQTGIELAYENLYGDDAIENLKAARKKVNRVIERFFQSVDIGDQGGVLTRAEQNELAEKMANAVTPKGLKGDELKTVRKELERDFRKFLAGRLDPANLIVDQETSSFVQKTGVAQAAREAEERRLGDADEILRSRNAQESIQKRLDELPTSGREGGARNINAVRLVEKRRSQLVAAMSAEVEAEQNALNYSGRTAVERARRKLEVILDFQKVAVERGTEVDASTVQAELEARKELADALEEEAQAAFTYNKSLLGAQDEIGRARADLTETFRQAAAARNNNDPAAEQRLLAQARDQANALPGLIAARDASARVAALDPRDQLGAAEAALQATRDQISATTVRGEDGAFTQAYLDLITQLKRDAQGLIEARANAVNEARTAFTNPGSAIDQASTAVLNAQTLLNTAKPGTSQYYQFLAQLNQAKLAYAQEEQAAVEANILANAGPDRLSKANAAVAVARRRMRFARRVQRGDYDTSGNLVGQAPDFNELGRGIGSQFADGVTEFDYEQLGAEQISANLVDGINQVDYFALGQSMAQQLSDGMLGIVGAAVSQLAIMQSLAASGGLRSADAIERGVTSPSGTYAGGVSAVTNKLAGTVVKGGVVSQQYGNKSSRYVGGVHKGVDIAAPAGSPIHSAAAGIVLKASYEGAYGNSVTVQGDDGTLYRYGHMSEFGVAAGQRVEAGQFIGAVGSTGNSTGNHVHVEVTKNGKAVDPTPYLGGTAGGTAGGKKGTYQQAQKRYRAQVEKLQRALIQRGAKIKVTGTMDAATRKAMAIYGKGRTVVEEGPDGKMRKSSLPPLSAPKEPSAPASSGGYNYGGGGGGGGSSREEAEAQAALNDALLQQRQAQLDLAKAKISSRVNPASSLSAARAQLKQARLDLKFWEKGTIEYYEALAAYQEAQFALAQALAERRAARRQASVFPGDAVRQARVDIKSASDQLKLAEKGTTEWYQAYSEWQQAQAALTQALVEAHKTRFLLNNDFTDPLTQARAETRAAQEKLERDKKAGAPKRVIEGDQLALKQAQASEEQVQFDENLKAIQTAERLGSVTHQAYIQYLQNEKSRLEAVGNRTYQQQQQLDQVSLLLKDASEAAGGLFNIGDIKMPTPYEVRRFMKTSAAGMSYQAGQAGGFGISSSTSQVSNQTTNITIDGADTGFILRVLTQYLGTTAVSRTSSATRKA